MPTRLPLDSAAGSRAPDRARAIAPRGSPAIPAPCCSAARAGAADWAALPHRRAAARLFEHKSPQGRRQLSSAGGRARANAAGRRRVWPAQATTFERLQAAGKLAARRIGVRTAVAAPVAAGLRPASRGCSAARHGGGTRGRGVPLRHLQEQAEARARRLRASTSPRRTTLPELDLTLATAAGNNLARWLTALPPNTLDAARLSPLAAGVRAPAAASTYRFYGEAQLQRLGAGAFLAVSRGNATRDAGIVRLAYRPRGARRAGLEPRRQGYVLRYRRHQLEAAQGHARHAYRHGGQRGGGRQPVCPARAALAAAPSIAGWRSPRIASARSPTSRRTWCAPTTARPSR